MPSAESVGKAAKSWVVMAGRTEKDPCGSAGPSQHTEVCNSLSRSRCAPSRIVCLQRLTAPPAHPAIPALSSSTGQETQRGENVMDRDKTKKITDQLLP
ncbi:unnamed protein product [Coccothraustes coccothraustes]